ncbi:MAG: hypothetical protein HQM13_14225 [SAR324 cluster bacterium]|nr:hypothetical protein [SAR324 cluster bacterium]
MTPLLFSQNQSSKLVFSQSEFNDIEKGFDEALSRGYFAGKKRFCDAGCGIGMVTVMSNILFHLESYGVEIQEKLYLRAAQTVRDLKDLFDYPIEIMQGDFGLSESYTAIRFDQIDIWFNYYNNFDPLVRKIRRESSPGTLFLLLKSFDQETEDMHGMQVLPAIELGDMQILSYKKL